MICRKLRSYESVRRKRERREMNRRIRLGLFHRCEVLVAGALMGLVACTASTPAANTSPGAPTSAQSSSPPLSLPNQVALLVASWMLHHVKGDAPECSATPSAPVPGRAQLDLVPSHYSATLTANAKPMELDTVSRAIALGDSSPIIDGKWAMSTDVYAQAAADNFVVHGLPAFTVPAVSVNGSFEIRHLTLKLNPGDLSPTDQDNGIVWRGAVEIDFSLRNDPITSPTGFGDTTTPPSAPSPSGFQSVSDSLSLAATGAGGHLTPATDSGQPTSLDDSTSYFHFVGKGCAPIGLSAGDHLYSAFGAAATKACIAADTNAQFICGRK